MAAADVQPTRRKAIDRLLAGALLMLCAVPIAAAPLQEAKSPPTKTEPDVVDFWAESPHARYAAAAQLIAARDPLLALGLRASGKHLVVWGLEEAPTPSVAPKLSDVWLSAVQDDKPFPVVQRKLPDEITAQEMAEIMAYTDALLKVATTPPAAFARSAAGNEWLTWSHLFREPHRFRGEVIPVEGKLVRLLREDPPRRARLEGVVDMYEGWVFMDTPGSMPVSVVFAKLPKGVEPSIKMDKRIRFHGYFFKRYLYRSKGGGDRRTLFFFAPTFEVLAQQAAPADPVTTLSEGLIGGAAILLLGVLLTAALVLTVSWWFRRNDAQVRRQVAAIRAAAVTFDDDQPSQPEGESPPRNRLTFPEGDFPERN